MAKTPPASARMPQIVFARQRFRPLVIVYMVVFIALAAAYVVLTLTHPPSKQALGQLHLNQAEYHWLIASIFVIFGIIWLTSLFGSLTFKSYSYLIRNSSDGRALNIVSSGLLVLAIAQPIGSFLSSLSSLIVKSHPDKLPTTTIVNNYINLFLVGAAMVVIAIGSDKIYKLAKHNARPFTQKVWVISFIILSAVYSYFIVIQPIHTPLARRAYFLPDWLLVFSIAIPYLIFWYVGLNAAYQINVFQNNIRGWLYKSALKYLAAGISAVIVSSIVTRILVTVSSQLSHLSLTPLLFIVYGLLLIDSVGFILIAIGAKRLLKLEEI